MEYYVVVKIMEQEQEHYSLYLKSFGQ